MIVSDEIIGEWVADQIGGLFRREGTICIGEIKEGEIVSGVIFEEYNGASVKASIATQRSFSRAFIREILRYPFEVVKVNCVYVTISTNNEKSKGLALKLGFKQIAHIPDAMPDGDMLILSLVKQDGIKYMR